MLLTDQRSIVRSPAVISARIRPERCASASSKTKIARKCSIASVPAAVCFHNRARQLRWLACSAPVAKEQGLQSGAVGAFLGSACDFEQVALHVGDQFVNEGLFARETSIQRAHADAGHPGDLVHTGTQPLLVEHRLGRGQQPFTVLGRVATKRLGRARARAGCHRAGYSDSSPTTVPPATSASSAWAIAACSSWWPSRAPCSFGISNPAAAARTAIAASIPNP